MALFPETLLSMDHCSCIGKEGNVLRCYELLLHLLHYFTVQVKEGIIK